MTIDPQTVFLWLAICFDGTACRDAQLFQVDQFDGPAAVTDCDKLADARAAQYQQAPDLPHWRMRCATVAQIEKEGI